MAVVRTVHCVADGPEIRHSKVQSAQVPMYPNLALSLCCEGRCVCASWFLLPDRSDESRLFHPYLLLK